MEKKVSIGFITFAIMMMMAFSVIPHHHHSMRMCFMTERCDLDGQVNDCHTSHYGSLDHHTDCKFFVRKSIGQKSLYETITSNTGKLFLLLFASLLGYLQHYLKSFFRKTEHDRFSVLLYTCLLIRCSGRRGPPVC